MIGAEDWKAAVRGYVEAVLGPTPPGALRYVFQHSCSHPSVMTRPDTEPLSDHAVRVLCAGRCPRCLTLTLPKG